MKDLVNNVFEEPAFPIPVFPKKADEFGTSRKSLQQVLKEKHLSRAVFRVEESNPAGHTTF
jgi:hypothetical protein